MWAHKVFVLPVFALACGVFFGQAPVLRLEREIQLPGVAGRIDHLSADLDGQRVFIAAIANGTVEVVDLRKGLRVDEIKALKEPQGVLYLPSNHTLYVATGGDGVVHSYDGRSLATLKSVSLGDDADNIRYNPRQKTVLVGYGTGGVASLSLDLLLKGEVLLPAHPEAFQVSQDGEHLFVNLPRNLSVASVDLSKQVVMAEWGQLGAAANFPMAFDEQRERLFLACRSPAQLLELDARTGAVVARRGTVGAADDLFFDGSSGLIYVLGGEGFIDVVGVQADGQLTAVAHVSTSAGARTGLLLPESRQLLVAAPRSGQNPARLLVYALSGR